MRRHRSTKILATLGPASDGVAMIRELVEAGADAFRLNFSHGTHDDHRKRYQAIRRAEKDFLDGNRTGVCIDPDTHTALLTIVPGGWHSLLPE